MFDTFCGCFDGGSSAQIRPPVRQPLAADALERKRRTLRIGYAKLSAIAIAKIEFG